MSRPEPAARPGDETSRSVGRRCASVVIPAFNEAPSITSAVRSVQAALAAIPGCDLEIIVVDDGSRDGTAEAAERAGVGVTVIRQERNRGKGAALNAGLSAARGDILMMLDADLGESAGECDRLLQPVVAGEADMTLAQFPARPGGGGFGLALRLARWGVRRLTGRCLSAPLSGQRAFTRAVWERVGSVAPGYGAETGLDVDVLRAGFRLVEVPTSMSHKATGRDWAGFRHRGRQCAAIARTLLARWLKR